MGGGSMLSQGHVVTVVLQQNLAVLFCADIIRLCVHNLMVKKIHWLLKN